MIGVAIISLVYIIYFALLNNSVLKHYADPANGIIGDSFGAINSVFSALAFLVIAASLYLQNKEFRLQREEFKASRNEQANSQKAMRELQVRNNFEGRLMFLLKNLERAEEKAQGNFDKPPYSSQSERYFDNLFYEMSWMNDNMYRRLPNSISNSPDYMTLLLQRYSLLSKQKVWVEDTKERPKDLSSILAKSVHEERGQEYFQAYSTFCAVVSALKKEFDAWTEADFGTPQEIERHFESYTHLFRSSLTHNAFLYLVLLWIAITKEDLETDHYIYFMIIRRAKDHPYYNAEESS